MTTAATSTHAPQTPGHARTQSAQGSQGANGTQAHGQRQAPADLFATLLALAADAAPVDGSATDALAAADAIDGLDSGAPAGGKTGKAGKGKPGIDAQDPLDEHPLAGLMLWQPPALDKTHPDLARAARGDTAVAASGAALTETQGAQALDTDPALRAADAAANGTARAPGLSWQVAATRAAQAQPAAGTPAALQAAARATGGNGADVPALRWSAAAPDAANAANAHLDAVRSTVTLDARFPAAHAALGGSAGAGAADDAAPGAAPSGTWTGPAAVGAAGNAAQADGSGGQAGAGPDSHDGHTRLATDDSTAQPNDPYAEARADAEAVEVQHWGGAHGLRHASLRVGEEAGRAIDIQLAVRGDEVRLDIRTDDSATRDALREQARAALGERLQQGGLQLADVSVGSQQQDRPREGHTPTLHQPRVQRDSAEPATPATPPARAQAAQRPANGGLDLFI